MSEVWFAIPSASVERCRKRLPAWRERGYKIAVLQNIERGTIPADIVQWSDDYPGWGESINILCKDIVPASADIVVSGGDDMLPDPDRSADELAADYFSRFPDGFGVMQPAGDAFMWAQNYCGSPWFGRRFFSTMYNGRGPMFGGYRHNWADYELYWVARCLGVLWMRDDAKQYHAHFSRENEETPQWWTRNVADKDQHDCNLFLSRKYRFFPGHEPKGMVMEFDEHELLRHESGIAEWKWSKAYAPYALTQPIESRMAETLNACAQRGNTTIAIYGAGSHTLKGAQALANPPVTIVAILDDDTTRHGSHMWGYPVVDPKKALDLPIDAVVLSSDSFEDTLWKNSTFLRDAGLDVVRIYGDTTLQEVST